MLHERLCTNGASVRRIADSAPPFWLFYCAYGIELRPLGWPMVSLIHGPFTSQALTLIIAR
jgi:hypothetical protein